VVRQLLSSEKRYNKGGAGSPLTRLASPGRSTFPVFSFLFFFHLIFDEYPVTTLTIMFAATNVAIDPTLFIFRVLSPSLVLLTTLSLLTTRPSPPPSPSPIVAVTVAALTPRRGLILTCLSFSSFIYLFDGLAFIIYAVINKYWPQRTGIEINALVGLVAFSGLAALASWKDVNGVDVWLFKRIVFSVFLSLILDVAQVIIYGTSMPKDHLPHPYPFPYDVETLLHFAFPVLRILFLVVLFFALVNPVVTYTEVLSTNETLEGQPTSTSLLLPSQEAIEPSRGLGLIVGGVNKYGTFDPSYSPASSHEVPDQDVDRIRPAPKEKEVDNDPAWDVILKRLLHITPYLWPKTNRPLQFVALLCVLILILGRLVNLAVPYILTRLVFVLEEGVSSPPWLYLSGYVGLRFLQSSGGLPALLDFLWTPVMQYSDCEMSLLSFNHLLHLSFAWHTHRKTGEVLRILDRGAAINNALQLVLFDIIPTFVDIVVALVVFAIKLDWMLTVVTFIVLSAYVVASVLLTRWRTRLRRAMNERDTITRGIHTDCLLNYETVKYFNGEEHEGERYRDFVALTRNSGDESTQPRPESYHCENVVRLVLSFVNVFVPERRTGSSKPNLVRRSDNP